MTALDAIQIQKMYNTTEYPYCPKAFSVGYCQEKMYCLIEDISYIYNLVWHNFSLFEDYFIKLKRLYPALHKPGQPYRVRADYSY